MLPLHTTIPVQSAQTGFKVKLLTTLLKRTLSIMVSSIVGHIANVTRTVQSDVDM